METTDHALKQRHRRLLKSLLSCLVDRWKTAETPEEQERMLALIKSTTKLVP